MYLEHNGDLRMLLAEKDQAQGTVHCFSLAEGALFVEAVPQEDISRRITAFQYELVSSQGPGAHMYPYLHPGLGKRMNAPILQCVCFLTCRLKRFKYIYSSVVLIHNFKILVFPFYATLYFYTATLQMEIL